MTTPSIEVIETTISIEVVDESGVEVLELIHPGPQGPAGASYVYTQVTPANTWTINHNLGYRPAVELLDSGSQEIDGEVAHPSIHQTIVTLNPATAGIARLT